MIDAHMVHDDEIENETEAWSSNRTSEWFANLTIILHVQKHKLYTILAKLTQYRKKKKKNSQICDSAVSKT